MLSFKNLLAYLDAHCGIGVIGNGLVSYARAAIDMNKRITTVETGKQFMEELSAKTRQSLA
jgi:hypothetical protein